MVSVILITMLFNKLLTAINIDQYNIYNRYNDYQPTSILVFNIKSKLVKLYLNNSILIDNHQSILNSTISEI